MTKIDTITGYHGTTKENALKIYDSQAFIPNEDEENELFLGRGVYFYLEKNNAVFWNIKRMKDRNKKIGYTVYSSEYDILEALLETEEDEILDLDQVENYLKFKKYLERVSNKLNESELYKNAKNKDAALINFMEKHGELGSTKVIKKIYYQRNGTFDNIRLSRTMLCVKDEKVIGPIIISEIVSEGIFDMVYEASYGKQAYA